MSASSSPALTPGTLIDGRYRLLSSIGPGRFGTVYEALHLADDKRVALRVVHPHLVGDPRTFGPRFFAEGARRLRLAHQNTLRVHDYGRTADDQFFIAMELVHGSSVARVLSARGPFLPALAARICQRLCASLEEAHRLGVIHGELSPELVWLTGRGLGGLKLAGYGDPALRGRAELTPWAARHARYSAPERLGGDKLTPAADVYGVGVVLFELLTGRPAFDHDSALRVLLNQRQGGPLSSAWRTPLWRTSPTLANIVERCLAVHPAHRYENVNALRQALGQHALRVAA